MEACETLPLTLGCFGQIWDAGCDNVVERGNFLKFSDEKLGRILLNTGDRMLVEASPNDRIVRSPPFLRSHVALAETSWSWPQWGVGFVANEAEGREAEWGENKLGKALMRVRERIRAGEKDGTWPNIVKLEGCTSCGR